MPSSSTAGGWKAKIKASRVPPKCFITRPATAATSPSLAGIVTLVGLIAFIISFTASLGPVVWTVITEIFPGHIRGRAVSICTAFNWLSAYLVSQFFLTLVDAIGSSLTFGLFATFCVIGWIWIFISVPETKGRSLENIQETWQTL